MKRPLWRRFSRSSRWAIAAGAVAPFLLHELLLVGIERAGGTTVVLGATSGMTAFVLAATVVVIVVRVFLFVVLPAVVAYAIALRIVRRIGLGPPSPFGSSSRQSARPSLARRS